jgi:hypothetical protein
MKPGHFLSTFFIINYSLVTITFDSIWFRVLGALKKAVNILLHFLVKRLPYLVNL